MPFLQRPTKASSIFRQTCFFVRVTSREHGHVHFSDLRSANWHDARARPRPRSQRMSLLPMRVKPSRERTILSPCSSRLGPFVAVMQPAHSGNPNDRRLWARPCHPSNVHGHFAFPARVLVCMANCKSLSISWISRGGAFRVISVPRASRSHAIQSEPVSRPRRSRCKAGR
jgi:hypothetical protein